MNLSIIIPAHNEERHIGNCISSLISQSYKNYEVIVINDDSIDKTEEIVRSLQKKNKKIKLIFNKCHSAASSRNKGAKVSKGRILVFVDADQYFSENFLQKISDDFKNKEVNALVGKVWGASKTFIGKCYASRKWLFWLTRQNKKMFLQKENPGCILAIKKSIFFRSGGFDESIFYREDTYFEQKIKARYKVFFDPSVVIYHFDPETFSEMFRHARGVGKGLATDFKKSGMKKIKLRLLEIIFWPIFLVLGILSIWAKLLIFSLLIIIFPLYYTVKTAYYSKDILHSFGFFILSIPKNFISTYSFLINLFKKED